MEKLQPIANRLPRYGGNIKWVRLGRTQMRVVNGNYSVLVTSLTEHNIIVAVVNVILSKYFPFIFYRSTTRCCINSGLIPTRERTTYYCSRFSVTTHGILLPL